MSRELDTFRSVFDEAFDRCVTTALRAAEWQDEAFDGVTVAMVEVATGIRAGEAEPWSVLEQRSAELSVEAGATRPGSAFLEQHLPRRSDDLRRAAGALSDALEDLDLDPGDTFTTPDWAGPLRDNLRDAIAAAVIGAGPDATSGRRWWSRR